MFTKHSSCLLLSKTRKNNMIFSEYFDLMMLKKREKDNFTVAWEEERTWHFTEAAGAAQMVLTWEKSWGDLKGNVVTRFAP